MRYPTILLHSITYAIRAQKVLQQHGIRTTVQKVPAGRNVKSCGYGLEISGDVQAAVQALRAADIPIVDIVHP